MLHDIIIFTIFFCIVGTAHSNDPVGRPCDTVGLRCSEDGSKVEFCKVIGDKAQTTKICPANTLCEAKDNHIGCIPIESRPLQFKCTGKGEFPDVKLLNQTYICSENDTNPEEVCTCPTGYWVYPAQGLYCIPDPCMRTSIICSEGEHGYFTVEPGIKTNYYYYCISPQLVEVYENVEEAEDLPIKIIQHGIKFQKDCRPFDSGNEGQS